MKLNKEKLELAKNDTMGHVVIRGVAVLSGLYMMILGILGGSAGMLPIWGIIFVGSCLLSWRKIERMICPKWWFRGPIILGIVIMIVVEGCILYQGFFSETAKDTKFIIVLGAKVNPNGPSRELSYRLDKAYDYLQEHSDVIAILSGGKGADEPMSEAEAMAIYLKGKGIEESRLILENKSTSTVQNLTNSFAIIEGIDPDAKVSIVTSRFHLLRAKIIAHNLGKEVGGVGSKSFLPLIPNYYFRECFAVMKEIVL